MINADKILKTIRLTEKSNKLSSNFGQYTFEVYPSATKFTVREAVEQTFKVTVTRVNIQNRKGKPKRSRQGRPITKSDSKRAIVTLKQGDKIELTA
jgi:large subunit ribosomal protein L23